MNSKGCKCKYAVWYKEIMEHIDEDEEDDMGIVSFTDRDILNKVRKNGYYTLNESIEELKKLDKRKV